MGAVRLGAGGPRLGFAGVGWIGRLRMESVLESGAAQVVALADPAEDCLDRAAALVPDAALSPRFSDLFELDLDGVVIATPSALHTEQALMALERGVAVYCQKPLARTAEETRNVVDAARRADRLLGIDLVYRTTRACCALRALVEGGALGQIHAGRFVFHNAYGPDKPWFYDRERSGGGCVIDLGTHLIDLALWLLGNPGVIGVHSRLFEGGRRLGPSPSVTEDYATIWLDLDSGASVEIACSWNLPAGCDAIIEASLFGSAAGAGMLNVGGSFYDFVTELYERTSRRILCHPPDPWGGRSLLSWVHRLARGETFDPAVESIVEVARVIDRVYGGQTV
jgi:predicted dehydrogenase